MIKVLKFIASAYVEELIFCILSDLKTFIFLPSYHHMEGKSQVIALWVGSHSQKTAHHFYALQVFMSPSRANNSLIKVKIPLIIMPFGHSKTNT